MKFLYTLLLVTAFLSGCAGPVLNNDSAEHAPKVKNKGGRVAYNPNGMQEIVRLRRNDALAKIHDVCGSNDYKIVKEEDIEKAKLKGTEERPEFDALANLGASKLHYLEFRCP